MTDLYGAIYQAILPFKEDIEKQINVKIDNNFINEAVDRVIMTRCTSIMRDQIDSRLSSLVDNHFMSEKGNFIGTKSMMVVEYVNNTISSCIEKTIKKYSDEIEMSFMKHVSDGFKDDSIRNIIYKKIANITELVKEKENNFKHYVSSLERRIDSLRDYICELEQKHMRAEDKYYC